MDLLFIIQNAPSFSFFLFSFSFFRFVVVVVVVYFFFFVPHDILRVSGEEAVQQYLAHEIQSVYRNQRVEINDKHIEIIIARMLRKVKIESAGDTNLLPGLICDRFDFQAVNNQLTDCIKVTRPGDSDFSKNQLVPKSVFE